MYATHSRAPVWGAAGRRAETTMPCRACEAPVTAVRHCRNVDLQCAACGGRYPLEDYIPVMDEVLETFLEGVFCDRM